MRVGATGERGGIGREGGFRPRLWQPGGDARGGSDVRIRAGFQTRGARGIQDPPPDQRNLIQKDLPGSLTRTWPGSKLLLRLRWLA